MSLSARRVWIEIENGTPFSSSSKSHSLRGECGLKFIQQLPDGFGLESLSARRVWIEIPQGYKDQDQPCVTLCEESVD